ncbi:OmpA family protein [uncultured Arcticibacterium sp.]|uniref:OmpA family protein n=1 Tax=uncultured Arcticibacterium sp. TaxID=2173042 RepID=UPI0030FCB9A8
MKYAKILLGSIFVSTFVFGCNESSDSSEDTAMNDSAEMEMMDNTGDMEIEAAPATNNAIAEANVIFTDEVYNNEVAYNFPLADTISKYSTEGRAGSLMSDWMKTYAKDLNANLNQEATVLHFGEGVIVALDKGDMYGVEDFVLNEDAKAALRKLAFNLQQEPDTYVLVAGRTDASGSAEFNDKLAFRRAAIAANYLKGCGIDESRFFIDSFGEKYPDYQNSSKINRDRNRRVDFLILPSNEMREQAAEAA